MMKILLKQGLQKAGGLRCTAILMLVPIVMSIQSGWAEKASDLRYFYDGIAHYRKGDYPSAIAAFGYLADAGIQNGKLFYNLGNAYLKNGDIGHAILYYERAATLMPGDPDLKFNLNYARTFLKDKPAETKTSIFGVLFFWKRLIRPRTLQWTALMLNMMFWLYLTVWHIRGKKHPRMLSMLLMSTAGLFIFMACHDYCAAAGLTARGKEAVILPNHISVRSGLSENATELFVLHAGTRIRIDKERNGYYRIYFSEGKIGWIPKKDVGVIRR